MYYSDKSFDDTVKECADQLKITPTKHDDNSTMSFVQSEPYKPAYVWKNILFFIVLHFCGFWGIWQGLSLQMKWQTYVWTYFLGWLSSEAIMVGTHRFYTHKCFKGNTWFKLLVVFTQTIAGQNCIYIWARDHRLHHKYSDTDADPHNSRRGFFFSHMGWLTQRKHPMVKLKGKNIDMSDLQADPLVMTQKKYYYPLYFLLAFSMPVFVPIVLWSESFKNALLFAYFTRYMVTLHGTWTVNSFAHFYGYRPYSKDIPPVESEFVAFISSGEGWHNYHHTFPWDYRAGEFGKKWNFSARIVDWFAAIGWAYDLKSATPEMVKHRIKKRGDGSHPSACATNPENEDISVGDETMSNSKFGEDHMEDIYGENISTEGFTVLRRVGA